MTHSLIVYVNRPHVDWFALSPSLAMLAASGLLLLVAVFVPRRARKAAAATGAAPSSGRTIAPTVTPFMCSTPASLRSNRTRSRPV